MRVRGEIVMKNIKRRRKREHIKRKKRVRETLDRYTSKLIIQLLNQYSGKQNRIDTKYCIAESA